ncbi:hypothetical protein HDU76_013802 [Blyttiomyces sp. JEL0837]|nr:hypothetical protein HDU76_013802 [Blyttiomyces sp. JEL0837]
MSGGDQGGSIGRRKSSINSQSSTTGSTTTTAGEATATNASRIRRQLQRDASINGNGIMPSSAPLPTGSTSTQSKLRKGNDILSQKSAPAALQRQSSSSLSSSSSSQRRKQQRNKEGLANNNQIPEITPSSNRQTSKRKTNPDDAFLSQESLMDNDKEVGAVQPSLAKRTGSFQSSSSASSSKRQKRSTSTNANPTHSKPTSVISLLDEDNNNNETSNIENRNQQQPRSNYPSQPIYISSTNQDRPTTTTKTSRSNSISASSKSISIPEAQPSHITIRTGSMSTSASKATSREASLSVSPKDGNNDKTMDVEFDEKVQPPPPLPIPPAVQTDLNPPRLTRASTSATSISSFKGGKSMMNDSFGGGEMGKGPKSAPSQKLSRSDSIVSVDQLMADAYDVNNQRQTRESRNSAGSKVGLGSVMEVVEVDDAGDAGDVNATLADAIRGHDGGGRVRKVGSGHGSGGGRGDNVFDVGNDGNGDDVGGERSLNLKMGTTVGGKVRDKGKATVFAKGKGKAVGDFDGLSKLFDGVVFFLNPILGWNEVEQIRSLLLQGGAKETETQLDSLDGKRFSIETTTHVITEELEFPEYKECVDRGVKIVLPEWVRRSLKLKTLQDTQYFSADPQKFMSGMVVMAMPDIPEGDRTIIYGSIRAFGGTHSLDLTDEVTHLTALDGVGNEVEQALSRGDVVVVLPHFFDDCLRLKRKVPDFFYRFPNPKLRELDPFVSLGKMEMGTSNTGPRPEGFLKDQVIFIDHGVSASMGERLYNQVVKEVEKAGGVVVEQYARGLVTCVILERREGGVYIEAETDGRIVGTLRWLRDTLESGEIHSPKLKALHYPRPESLPDFQKFVICATNYSGKAREDIEAMIVHLGGTFTKQMTPENTHVICAKPISEKYAKALEWDIVAVNHLWLENTYVKHKVQVAARIHYLYFPPNLAPMVGDVPVPPEEVKRSLEVARRGLISVVDLSVDEGVTTGKVGGSGGGKGKGKQVVGRERVVTPVVRRVRGGPVEVEGEGEGEGEAGTGGDGSVKNKGKAKASVKGKERAYLVEGDGNGEGSDAVVVVEGDVKGRDSSKDDTAIPAAAGEVEGRRVQRGFGTAKRGGKAAVGTRSSTVETVKDVESVAMQETISPSPSKRVAKTYADRKTTKTATGTGVGSSSVTGRRAGKAAANADDTDKGGAKEIEVVIINDPDDDEDDDEIVDNTKANKTAETVEAAGPSKRAKTKSPAKPATAKEAKATKAATSKVKAESAPATSGKAKASVKTETVKAKTTKVTDTATSGTSAAAGAAATGAGTTISHPALKRKRELAEVTPKSSPGVGGGSTSGKRKKVDANIAIVTTGIRLDKQTLKGIVGLGGREAKDVASCTHLVANKIARTEKFLLAVSMGKEIVTQEWIERSLEIGSWQDSTLYRLKDPEAEEKNGFTLEESLRRASEKRLLEGYSVYVTQNVKPDIETMKRLVEAGGGKFVKRQLRTLRNKNNDIFSMDVDAFKQEEEAGDNSIFGNISGPSTPSVSGSQTQRRVLCISCDEDGEYVEVLKGHGYRVYSVEMLLVGLLRQELVLEDEEYCL